MDRRKNLSFPGLLSFSLTTTTKDEHRLLTVEVLDSIKFVMTHNQNTQPIQCHYAVSREHNTSVSTDTPVESPHFPIYHHTLQIKNNYFKMQLENDLYHPVSYNEFHTKAQPLDHIHKREIQHFKNNHSLSEIYPIIQHTGVTLNTKKNKTLYPI